MAGPSSIEWTDATWNPIVGCSVLSPGCTNCYAMKFASRLGKMQAASPYAGLTQDSKAGPVWNGKVAQASPETLETPFSWKKPRRVFVNSMGDLFHENVPDAWIDAVFAVMALCPQHSFQVLTKRAQRMREYFLDRPARNAAIGRVVNEISDHVLLRHALPLPNVWLGVSVEDQKRADERIPSLLATPAAVRFLSCEPLLGPVDITAIRRPLGAGPGFMRPLDGRFNTIDWVIVGGESGPSARPMHPDWARSLRDQCAAAGVPYFFKQHGEWSTVYDRQVEDPDWQRCDVVARQTPNGRWLNLEGGHGFHGERVVRVDRVGKKVAGRILDGSEHNAFPPEVAA